MSVFGWTYPPGVTGNEPVIAGPGPHDRRCPQHEDRLVDCSVSNCTAMLCWPWLNGAGPDSDIFGAIVCAEHATDGDCPSLGQEPVLVLPEAAPCKCDELAEGDREHAALERWERRREEQP